MPDHYAEHTGPRCTGERADGWACQRRVTMSGLCWQHRLPLRTAAAQS